MAICHQDLLLVKLLGSCVHLLDCFVSLYQYLGSLQSFKCFMNMRFVVESITETKAWIQSANLRGRREVNKKLAELQNVANQRMSIIEAKAEDHTRFLIQEYLFNRTNAMDS